MSDPVFRRADRVVFLSESQRGLYLRAGVPEDKTALADNFLPSDLDPGLTTDEPRAGWLFVGRLAPEKGIRRLLRHWPIGQQLRIVGDGPLREDIAACASEVDGVELLGPLPRTEVIRVMKRSRGLLFPSLWFEGLPLVYLEALACGLPVAAFEPNAVADLVRRDATGIVIEWSEDIASRLAECGLSRQTPRELREVFLNRYSEAAFAERSTQFYCELLGSDR